VNILALDTSTEACSAALRRRDGEVFGEFELAPRRHNRLLPEMMDRVLEAAGIARGEITHCAFANGPGAFTGIRIGAAQAQGIGIALGIPLLPISTLAVLAQTALERYRCRRVMAALDARMQEIYWAVYERDDRGLARLRGSERLDPADAIEIEEGVDLGAGHGWTEDLRPMAEFPLHPELLPDSRALLVLAVAAACDGGGVDAGAITINYLRNRVAEKSRV
jgi:tRNA threonylcarbamoyladenosine biosynthesis protein TsaB